MFLYDTNFHDVNKGQNKLMKINRKTSPTFYSYIMQIHSVKFIASWIILQILER